GADWATIPIGPNIRAHSPDVARPTPPHTEKVEKFRRAAPDDRPGAAVPVENVAGDRPPRAHRPDVARPAAPNAAEVDRRAARGGRPAAAVPVEDGATDAHPPESASPAPPNGAHTGLRG